MVDWVVVFDVHFDQQQRLVVTKQHRAACGACINLDRAVSSKSCTPHCVQLVLVETTRLAIFQCTNMRPKGHVRIMHSDTHNAAMRHKTTRSVCRCTTTCSRTNISFRKSPAPTQAHTHNDSNSYGMGITGSTGVRPSFYFIGDSITEQGSSVQSNGFVALLQSQYVRSVDAINRGLSGYNTRCVLLLLAVVCSRVGRQYARALSCHVHSFSLTHSHRMHPCICTTLD